MSLNSLQIAPSIATIGLAISAAAFTIHYAAPFISLLSAIYN